MMLHYFASFDMILNVLVRPGGALLSQTLPISRPLAPRRKDGQSDGQMLDGWTRDRSWAEGWLDGRTVGRSDGRADGRSVGWSDSRADGWTVDWSDGSMDGWADRRLERTDRRTDGWSVRLKDGRTGGWTDCWTDSRAGRTEGRTDPYF
jgi:hypothetical protein